MGNKVELLNLEERILRFLLLQTGLNDSKRFFAGLRRPSKLWQTVVDKIFVVCEKRARIMANG